MAFFTDNQIQEMDYKSLLEHAKIQLSKNETGNYESACSKEELLDLCGILNDKIDSDYKKTLALYNNPPEYPSFTPSDRLRALKEERAELMKQSGVSIIREEGRKKQKKHIGQYEKMSSLYKEIVALHRQEVEDHRKRSMATQDKYDLARKEYFEKKKKVELREEQKRQIRSREVEKLRLKILNYFESRQEGNMRKVYWQILPPGTWSLEQITKHFSKLKNADSTREYDLERLELLQALKPATCYVGLDEFVGYIVFCFDYTNKTILENPIKGNAIYVIDSNWPELSQLAKRKLLSCHPNKVKRIIHRGNWFDKLKDKIAKADAA